MRLVALPAVLLLMACGDPEPELPELTLVTPTATVAATPTPEPSPTPTPGGDIGRANEIAASWVEANPDKVAALVAEAALASDDADDLNPIVLTTFGSLVRAAATDAMGNELSVTLDSAILLPGGQAAAGFLVEGRVTGLGAVSAVEVSVPIVLTMDLAAETVTLWEVNVPGSTVTIELGG